MKTRNKIIMLTVLALIAIVIFLFWGLNANNISYNLPRRFKKLLAISITSGVIAFSSLIFQTITNNRILTPSVLGLDSLYVLIQTTLIFAVSSKNLQTFDKSYLFIISVGLMVGFSMILFKLLFRKENQSIFFLVLVGMIIGSFFGSLSTFMQVLIDPNEFLILQGKLFASFNNVNTKLLGTSMVLIAFTILFIAKDIKYLDVISLGKEHAINLGVNYNKVIKKFLIVISILISVSTALVGPIIFLGILVVNIAREMMKTYKHSILITGSVLVSIIALIYGQLLVERVLEFSVTVSVIINFIGGSYFIYLLLKESRS